MIVEQQQDCLTLNDASDILAGWKNMPTFVLGYVRIPPKDSVTPFYVVGIFACSSGPDDKPARGQKEVSDISVQWQQGEQLETGIQIVAAERRRQIWGEGFAADHDAKHGDESMAIVASCYASPSLIYIHVPELDDSKHVFRDPWPRTWAKHWDKRGKHDRIRQLAIAGALCAAEIDRLKARQNQNDDLLSPRACGNFLDELPPAALVGDNLINTFGQREQECAAQVIIKLAVEAKSWRVRIKESDFPLPANEAAYAMEREGFHELIRNSWLMPTGTPDQHMKAKDYWLTASFVKRLKEKRPDAFGGHP